jgi:hypothetical protein
MVCAKFCKVNGVAKNPPSGVVTVFQNLDIPMYVFAFEKPFRLAGRTFGLAMASGSSPNYAVAIFQNFNIQDVCFRL